MNRMTMDEITAFAADDAAVAAATRRVLQHLEQNELTFPFARETSALVFLAGAGAVERERARLIERVRALGSAMAVAADDPEGDGKAHEGWRYDDSSTPARYHHPKMSEPVDVAAFGAAFPQLRGSDVPSKGVQMAGEGATTGSSTDPDPASKQLRGKQK